ncbi:SagB family peptide dehydrogenase [Pyxidicoccus caerfyrddinensis]|uniref:SagB family peptide dehydrogenase n=1 Tax=Pyxidicoccus caerfyrddinensis TaxID=2709663 RepID=UPI0013DA94E3|nr:SagB family peptide dehydrogenase [Pyxidicoccus caerfyrddinensis]
MAREPINPHLLRLAVYSNSFSSVTPAARATALRTNPFRFGALRQLPEPRIAEDFLIASRLRRRDIDLESSIGGYYSPDTGLMLALIGREGKRGSRTIPLPASAPLRMNLGHALHQRRSVRSYTGDAMSLAHLATLARAAAGKTGELVGASGEAQMPVRSVPSGGGLYPIDLWFAGLRVDKLPRGVYVYSSTEDLLWAAGDGKQVDALVASLANPANNIGIAEATAICILVARPWRSMRKYGARGMRNVFLEAGAIAEHVNLAATALGLGSVDCGSFYDDEANEALGLDGVYETLVHALVLGVPA